MNTKVDVVILGGGLAGLSLSIQLKRMDPALHVTVIERQRHPVREAAFKVGESTVEIAAHYFGHVLGLREHLEGEQIRKFGFRFFFSDGVEAIDRCTELGVSKLLPMVSWQLDRGRFENFLGERARELGVVFLDDATVKHVVPGGDGNLHVVDFEHEGDLVQLEARWLVDASGRASLLKRKFDLVADNPHDVNAAWWRVDGIVDPNQWSNDGDWLSRCTPPHRWRSTNHLCGRGYWAWMIPLASGAHSIGIVADGALHPLEQMKTHALATDWLREHQPALATLLDDPRHAVQDFRFLRHFSHGCRQVFSGDRWAITGEAGLFLDPFYSPGSDFIAIGNTYICDLIQRDRAGTPFAPYAAIYQQLIDSFFDNTMTLYRDQYALFGDARVMPLKVIWDYTYYWSVLAPLFTGSRMTDVAMLGRLRPVFERATRLNIAVQALLREWGERNGAASPPQDGRVLDQYLIPWFHELNRALTDPPQDDVSFHARIAANVVLMDRLAAQLLGEARRDHPQIEDFGLTAMLADVMPGEPLLQAPWVE
ncbi:NAD(P)/FAD-dependent oxidoreductase [Solilutibacter silvestris]|uniref:Tryptophan halogenase n=1 Tax=Solilutibacter silvestris TaxID=1645665 RepID=A0A2K1Q0Y6_9GAMM|nr:tryptophan 7-halogenase [Lysobacter silvestris]PNS08577.1 Tryptophan halogenase [Lysobacter silvestris]